MSEAKKPIQIPNAPAPIGPYSQAILKDQTLYISGQIPLNPKNGHLELKDITLSTKIVLENIASLLEAAGFDIQDVVMVSIFLKDMDSFEEMNRVYADFFKSIAPARQTIQVPRLPLDAPIEISCIAQK